MLYILPGKLPDGSTYISYSVVSIFYIIQLKINPRISIKMPQKAAPFLNPESDNRENNYAP